MGSDLSLNCKSEVHAVMKCQKCGAEINGKFCSECGTPAPQSTSKFCSNCGKELTPGKAFCGFCGASANGEPPQIPKYQQTINAYSQPSKQGIMCPKCKQTNVAVQAIAETDKRGCFATLMWLFLICLTLGLALIPLLRGRKSTTRSYAVCQTCGYRWLIQK